VLISNPVFYECVQLVNFQSSRDDFHGLDQVNLFFDFSKENLKWSGQINFAAWIIRKSIVGGDGDPS